MSGGEGMFVYVLIMDPPNVLGFVMQRRFNIMAIKRLKDIMCYRGKRHLSNLPCRGQHTKCNARTRRGKKIAIAGKKK